MQELIDQEFDNLADNVHTPWINKDKFHLFFSNIIRYAFEDLFDRMDIAFLLTRKVDFDNLSTK